MRKIRKIKGIKGVFIASGIRHDLILSDRDYGIIFLEELIGHHVSGQLKIAPEHTEDNVLKKMGKQGKDSLIEFKDEFYRLTKKKNKRQFLTYYLIAAHPGCDINDMRRLKEFAITELKTIPEQVQIFTPTPSTYSTLMYHTGVDPFTGEKIFVEKNKGKKELQFKIIVNKSGNQKKT